MNCSKEISTCLSSRRTRRKIKNFILKSLTFANGISLLFWIMCIDYIVSWQPYLIMAINFGWLWMMAYANGWVTDTEPYYERLEREQKRHER